MRTVFYRIKKYLGYFSRFEWGLWIFSITATLLSFLLGNERYPLTLIASLLGVTSLIFIAKGNVIGQFIVIIFSLLYGVISIGASKLPADDTLLRLQESGTTVYRTDLNGTIVCSSDGYTIFFETEKTATEDPNG